MLSEDIVDRLRHRDEAAFNELLRVAGPSLIAFVMSYGPTRDEAEDILQTMCVRIWHLGAQFTPAGSIEAYLFAAARNEALKALRNAGIRERHVRRYANEITRDNPRESAFSPEEASPWEEEVAAIRQSLAILTEHQRTAFELRYGQEMTIPEIARVLGISPKGVERLMTRINKLLRERVIDGER